MSAGAWPRVAFALVIACNGGKNDFPEGAGDPCVADGDCMGEQICVRGADYAYDTGSVCLPACEEDRQCPCGCAPDGYCFTGCK